MTYTPKSEAELAELVAGLSEPVQIKGGGTRAVGRSEGEVLSLAGLSGVSLYEPGALTLVAGAGTPLAEIETMLAGEGQRLAFEPMDHRVLLGTTGAPTLGGAVAANVSGPRRIAVGACRDFTLGVRFVDGAGRILKNGGRVMKNVTGYDLVKLMAGSWGTLGAISEVSLKVLPAPETEATLAFDAPTAEQALALMSGALGSPFEVTGAAWINAQVFLRLEGFAQSVAYRADALEAKLGAADRSGAEASAAFWADLRDVRAFADKPVVAKLSIRPSLLADVAQELGGMFDAEILADWGGGLVWVAAEARARELAEMLQAYAQANGGHATLMKAPKEAYEQVSTFQPEAQPLAVLSRALRAQFDPNGLFNPGLMAPA